MSLESEFNEYAELLEFLETVENKMVSPEDFSSLTRGLTSASTLVDRVLGLLKKKNSLEAQELMAALMMELADARIKIADIKEQVAELKDENRELKEKLKRELEAKENPVELVEGEHGLWYVEGSSNPVCKTCRDSSGNPIELSWTKYPIASMGKGKFKCSKCDYSKTI